MCSGGRADENGPKMPSTILPLDERELLIWDITERERGDGIDVVGVIS